MFDLIIKHINFDHPGIILIPPALIITCSNINFVLSAVDTLVFSSVESITGPIKYVIIGGSKLTEIQRWAG